MSDVNNEDYHSFVFLAEKPIRIKNRILYFNLQENRTSGKKFKPVITFEGTLSDGNGSATYRAGMAYC
jgi:hypothetical protein